MRSLRLFLFSPLPVAADARGTLAGLPGLARIVSRARTASLPDMDLESVLLASFGVQRQRDWPVAPFSWLGEGGEAGARYWLRADPVHLRAERDAVLLVDARHFALETESADALIGALNAHFAVDGLRFFAPNPTRWYVAVDWLPEIATSPLHAAAGRNIDLGTRAVRVRDGHPGARKSGDIGFASLRGGTVVGEHSVIFAGSAERIELVHRAEDRMIFARGALHAAAWARSQKPGLYSMADVLGLKDF